MTFSVAGTTVITTDRIVQLTSGVTASRPASPAIGQLFYDTTIAKVIVWNGAAWREPATSLPTPQPSLMAWGSNTNGRIGDNTVTNRSSPVNVVAPFTDWVEVGGGYTFTTALRSNGTIWAWGQNTNGQLGDSTTVSKSSPVSVVGGFTDWVQVSGGNAHTAALRSNGTAWVWGRNNNGQIGDNTTVSKSSPVSVVGGFTDWIQISAGYNSTMGLRSNGTIWGWGYGGVGVLGNNGVANQSSPVSVVGGFTDWIAVKNCPGFSFFTGAIRANGTAWMWGENTNGQLGDNTLTNRSSPVSVLGGFTDWTQITLGTNFTVGLRANGGAWGWGNQIGAGIGTPFYTRSPQIVIGGFTDWVQISSTAGSTFALRSNGTAWAWGYNTSGALGNNSASAFISSPVSIVGGFTDWVQISSGSGLRNQAKTKNRTNKNTL